jgi:hypothetical protein
MRFRFDKCDASLQPAGSSSKKAATKLACLLAAILIGMSTFLRASIVTLFLACALPMPAGAADQPLTPEQKRWQTCDQAAREYSSRKKKRKAYFEECMRKAAAKARVEANAAANAAAAAEQHESEPGESIEPIEPVEPAVKSMPPTAQPASAQPEEDGRMKTCVAEAEARKLVGLRRVYFIDECTAR